MMLFRDLAPIQLLDALDDGEEVGRLQGRAANQTAVDVGLGKQTGRVAGLHAAAVQDAGVFRNARAEVLSTMLAVSYVDTALHFFTTLSKASSKWPSPPQRESC